MIFGAFDDISWASSANYNQGVRRSSLGTTSTTSISHTITPGSRYAHPHSAEIYHNAVCWDCQDETESQVFQSSDNLVDNYHQYVERGTTIAQVDENLRYEPDPNVSHRARKPTRHITWKKILCTVWIWEITGIILSICLVVTIYAILGSFNGKMTSSWTLRIHLTTLVALLSAIIRAIIIAISAQIVSQAKWTWFWNSNSMPATRARPLSEMQAFDDASRGPLGSILLMRTVFRNPPLMLVLSIGIFSIVMGSLSQQAIGIVKCNFEDPTQDAFIPNVQTLGYQYNVPSLSLKGAIISSLTNPNGSDSMIRSTCSSGNCTFPTFKDEDNGKDITHRSIALCSYCVDVSSHIMINHTMKSKISHEAHEQANGQVGTDTWYLPNNQEIWYETDNDMDDIIFMDARAANLDISWANHTFDDKFVDLSTFALINTTVLISGNPQEKESAKAATTCTLYPCVQSYIASINNGELSETIVSSDKLSPFGQWFIQNDQNNQTDNTARFIYPSDMMAIKTPCMVDGKVFTKSNLSSAPRTQNIARYEYSSATPTGYKKSSDDVDVPAVNISAPAECMFGVDYLDWYSEMRGFLQSTFTGTCRFRSGDTTEDFTQADNINCTHFWLESMYTNNPSLIAIQTYMDSFAQSVTRRFRMAAGQRDPVDSTATGQGSQVYIREDYGVNVTGISGTAWQTTTCFAVDWWWLLLPSALTVLTAFMLAWTLIKGMACPAGGVMAWKSSLLPFLYYRERMVSMVTDHGYEYSFSSGVGKDLTDLRKLNEESKHVRVVFQGS